jgi:protease-4
MKPALNLPLLSRVLAQPWAVRREILATFTQAILTDAGAFPQRKNLVTAVTKPVRSSADTSFNVWQWDGEEVVCQPLKTSAGYTILNFEGLAADRRGALPSVPENVNVFLVWGPLGRGWTMVDRWWFDAIEVDELTASLAATAEGSTNVLWFRSPGGIVTGIPETAAELRRLGKTRRLLAFTDELCASAAYWLAAQCERIVATPTADVGSIGVYLAFYDFCAYLEKAGVKLELFKAGDLKGTGLMGNPLDDAARAHLQAGVAESYRQFTKDVTNMRKLDDATMQGQCLTGKGALAANLIDAFAPSAASFFAALGKGKI